MKTSELSSYELDIIANSLKQSHLDYEHYIKWIDDQPMLPDRQIAIDKIKQEVRQLISLRVKIYDIREQRKL